MAKKCKNTECNKEVDGKYYCSLSCRNVYVNKYLRDYSKNGAGISKEKQYLANPKKCISCSSVIEYKKRRNNFCSKNCSASNNNTGRKHSEKTKIKIRKITSISILKKWKDPEYIKKSLVNHGKRRFNSKGEIEVREYFMKKFPEHKWTSGGFIDIGNERMTTVDMVSKELKMCVEYDGIWHFKDINGQLEKKQLKDKLLNEWCANNGYRIIRISEEYYKKNKSLSLEKLEKEILFGKKKLVKLY
jgi:predicted nucleic acid-binding Zn ribbon protein